MGKDWNKNNNKPKAGKYAHSGLLNKVFEQAFDEAFLELEDLASDQIKLQEKINKSYKDSQDLDNCLYLILEKQLSTITKLHLKIGIKELKRMKKDFYAEYFALANLCLALQVELNKTYEIINKVELKKDAQGKPVFPYVSQESISADLKSFLQSFGTNYKEDWQKNNSMPIISKYINELFKLADKQVRPFLDDTSLVKLNASLDKIRALLPDIKDIEIRLNLQYSANNN